MFAFVLWKLLKLWTIPRLLKCVHQAIEAPMECNFSRKQGSKRCLPWSGRTGPTAILGALPERTSASGTYLPRTQHSPSHELGPLHCDHGPLKKTGEQIGTQMRYQSAVQLNDFHPISARDEAEMREAALSTCSLSNQTSSLTMVMAKSSHSKFVHHTGHVMVAFNVLTHTMAEVAQRPVAIHSQTKFETQSMPRLRLPDLSLL